MKISITPDTSAQLGYTQTEAGYGIEMLRPIAHFFNGLGRRLAHALVQEVPAELDACEMCRETDCSQSRWDRCGVRLEKYEERTGIYR